ncbi:MAG TPA: hypothetical protein DCF62_06710, partial [Porticoccaceae bacterium]|nr:hypothetical protein [Porticoccaceae bacterium]
GGAEKFKVHCSQADGLAGVDGKFRAPAGLFPMQFLGDPDVVISECFKRLDYAGVGIAKQPF